MKAAIAAGLALGGLLAVDAAAQDPPTYRRDRLLEQAGFVMRSADTPQKVARMTLLPPLQFVSRQSRNGHYYLYADPKLCGCVFVGNQQAMDNYKTQILQVPVGELAPTQNAPAAPPNPFTEVHEVGEDIFGNPVDEDILDWQE